MKITHWLCAALVAVALTSAGCNRPGSSSSDNANSGPNGSSANQAQNGSNNPSGNGAQGGSGPQQSAAQQPIVVPAGSVITVRLSQPLNSKENHAGDPFSGSLAEPVEVDGHAVIERGAAAHGTVVDAKAMGHFKGGALLQLQLTSVTINGERRPIETSVWSETLKGKGKRTAVLAGGGAGLGALIGGLAGGGKGAAIGAVAGGGAGTAGAAYTGNKEIQLNAESAVQFKLRQSIRVQ